ncbi:MarR family winged helix-turn-helix transcriptional regulator [Aliiruegeria sabulilitoris]|uniref:MarR family winged helix-turn-helix transcriptional regulator n=1 Tax=Aliiruegeria sabulilitoris TaxID=1510458 RepID=UPI00082CEDF8|nr:MarR family transcriptional regulator [Aliiruegeria sabulilitoris]NDR59064.1 MarR family transcriptional regulator [Pseudoruegeria sp. M32A2M]
MNDPKNFLFGDEIQRVPQELRIILGNFVLTHALEERICDVQDREQLSKSERHMLINLGIPRRMGQMAEDLNTLPSKVTAIADLLEMKELVLRERDPDDRRAWQLRLTERGQQARTELIALTVKIFRDVAGLSDTEIEHLSALMDRVTAHVLETGFPKGMTL